MSQRAREFNSLECKFSIAPGNLAEHAQVLLEQMSSEDVMEVLQAVMQFSMHLAVAPEDAFGSLPMSATIKTLIACLQNPLPDIGLYAIISLNHVMDSLPNSTRAIASAGGLSVMCAKLMNFEYIDMAEHIIKALERLSFDHSAAILAEGAFATMLNMVDFFELTTQKRIVNATCATLKTLQNLNAFLDFVVPSLVALIELLRYRGPEFVCVNLLAVRAYLGMTESLERLCAGDLESLKNYIDMTTEHQLLERVLDLVPQSEDLKDTAFQLLSSLCKLSPTLTERFHQLGAVGTIKDAMAEHSADAVHFKEALRLLDAILPNKADDAGLACVYTNDPALLRSIGEMILPRILNLYERIANKGVRTLILQIMDKVLTYSEVDVVRTYATPPKFSNFLSELLGCKDTEAVKNALSIAFELLKRIPEEVAVNFVREGVMDKVHDLTDLEKVKQLSFPNFSVQNLIASSSASLRQLLPMLGSLRDPATLEEVLRMRALRHLISEGEDPETVLARSNSEPPSIEDMQTQMAQELVDFAILVEKHFEPYFKPEATKVMQELKDLTISMSTDESEGDAELIRRLCSLLAKEESVSLHELTVSGVLNGLWKWFTSKPAKTSLRRIHDFLRVTLENSVYGTSHFDLLIQTIVKAIRYTQQFIVLIYESAELPTNTMLAMKSLANRVKLQLEYDPIGNHTHPDIDLRNVLFTTNPKFTFTLEQYQTLDTFFDALRRAKTPQHLALFASSFDRTSAEVRSVNQGQLNLVRQSMKMQNLLTDSVGLAAALEEIGLRVEGNEQLLEEIHTSDPRAEQEGSKEDESEPIEAIQFQRKESALEPQVVQPVLTANGVTLNPRMSLFEILNKYSKESKDCLVIKFHFEVIEEVSPSYSRHLDATQLFEAIVNDASHAPVNHADKIYSPLRMLKLLYTFNQHLQTFLAPGSILFPNSQQIATPTPVSAPTFINFKLSALLAKQLSDMLSMVGGVYPAWINELPRYAPYLFGFPLRLELFRSSSFGNGRPMYFYAKKGKLFSVRMLRQKAMIPRDQVLEAALRIFSDTSLLKYAFLEFDFHNEEGTGTGPTLEFYNLVSTEIKKLEMWRTGQEGLFPAPIQTQNPIEVTSMFRLIGKIVAKALYDDKLVDLPFAPAFWKLVMNKPVSLFDVLDVDYELGRQLLDLRELVNRYQWVTQNIEDEHQKEKQLAQITLKDVPVDELCITFTLPGYDIELKPNGKNCTVQLDTLEEYINLVVNFTLLQHLQADAFREGFEKLIPLKALELFEFKELEGLICGCGSEDWELSTLQEHLVPDHGFSKQSPMFSSLLRIMTEFTADERRHFLQFVTGSPRLPVGGFKALSPPLTVVRKLPSDGKSDPDKYLPSVMTCQNFLKIPEYSTSELLKERLIYAIFNGHQCFHLS